jgi:hypothetical protein
MSQMTWTHIADDGSRHKVGLFHGNTTGHVLVYCDARIIVIDFNIRTSKKYSFFINDQLFDLEIEEKEGKFSYGFKSDMIADTPYNVARRKADRKQNKQVLLLAIFFILCILIVFYFVFGFNG